MGGRTSLRRVDAEVKTTFSRQKKHHPLGAGRSRKGKALRVLQSWSLQGVTRGPGYFDCAVHQERVRPAVGGGDGIFVQFN